MDEQQKQQSTAEPTLEKIQKENEEYRAGWQRERADFQNYKKESERLRTEVVQAAQSMVLIDLLKVADYYDSAIAHVPAESLQSPWGQGLVHIQKELQNILVNYGVSVMRCVGEMFSPARHEAIGEVPDTGKVHGTIVEEAQRGYLRGETVLRPARVRTAQ